MAPEDLTPKYRKVADEEGIERAACDYVAGMTDSYAMDKFAEFFIPSAWTVK
jgi:dGTPase